MSSNLPAVNVPDLGKSLVAAKQRRVPDSGDMPFLRLIKSGEWVYGSDDVDVQEGSKWAANPTTLMEGFCAWGDGELLGEEMQPMTNPTPLFSANLPDVGAPYKRQIAIQFVCINGDDEGQAVMYKTSSKGGLKAASGLIDAIITQIETTADDDGEPPIVPVIKFEVSHYKHKEYGRVYTPILDIVEWATMGGSLAAKDSDVTGGQADDYGDDDADEPAEEEAPKQRKRRRPIAS
jgi:hypothetical protein